MKSVKIATAKETIIAIVGPYDQAEKQAIAILTGLKQAKIKRYSSIRQLIDHDRHRPNFDLLVIMSSRIMDNLDNLKTLLGPKAIMCLDLQSQTDDVFIRNCIAHVSLRPTSDPRKYIFHFHSMAARGYGRHHKPWPKDLAAKI